LCQQTGLKAGTLYPILIRLADRNWLETTWETGTSAGRPPRHLYRLTETGLAQARAAGAVEARSSKAKRLRPRPRLGES
jgi:PadR family transcriptional regulator PadR